MKTPETQKYRPALRLVARVMAGLMIVAVSAVGPVPALAAPSPHAPKVSAPLPSGKASPAKAPAASGAAPSRPKQDGGSAAGHRDSNAAPAAEPRAAMSAAQEEEQKRAEQAKANPIHQSRPYRDDSTSPPSSPPTGAGPVAADGPPSSSTESSRLVSLSPSAFSATYAPSLVWNPSPHFNFDGAMSVTVKNTSSVTWLANTVALGYHIYDNNNPRGVKNWQGLETPFQYDVPPGFNQPIVAPVEHLGPGTWHIFFDMVDLTASNYGARYFSQNCCSAMSNDVQITVPHYPPFGDGLSPLNNATVSTTMSPFTVNIHNDEWPGLTLSAWFEACTDTLGHGCVESGWINANPDPYPGSFATLLTWTPPLDRSFMPRWNTQYVWRVRVKDSGLAPQNVTDANAPWSSFSNLYPVVQDPPGPSHFGVDPAGLDGAGVNMWLGNYTRQENDLGLPAPAGALPLQITRTYNSANSQVGAFGTGWSSLLDVSKIFNLNSDGTFAIVTFPDGKQISYGQNYDGSWTPAYGEDQSAVFVSQGFDQHLDFGSGTRYQFADTSDPQGLYQISTPDGDTQTLMQTNGKVTQIKDSRTNRSLYLTWTGNHVASVSTAPAGTFGALTWNYTYTGDLLTKVCDVQYTPNCTTYGYGETGPIVYRRNPGKCIDVDAETYGRYSNEPRNGKRIQLWDCNNTPGQQWAQYPDGTLRVMGKCLDTSGHATGPLPVALVLWDCNPSLYPTQRWQYQSGDVSSLLNLQTGSVTTGSYLDLNVGNQTNGTQIQIWSRNNADPQKWNLPGGSPRLVSIQRPNPNNLTTIDYSGANVARVGDGYNPLSHYWDNSWIYTRTNLDPNTNDRKALKVQVSDPTMLNTTYQFLIYEFGTSGQLLDRTIGGNIRSWQYAPATGQLANLTDENGNLTDYYWGGLTGGLVDVNRYRDASTTINTEYSYLGDDPVTYPDPATRQRYGRNPLTIRDANGNKVTMTYNNGLLATRTDATPAKTSYSYTCDNGATAPAAVNDPGGTQPCRLLASVTDPDLHVTYYGYDRYGNRTWEQTPTNRRTLSTFNALGRMTSQTVYTSSNPDPNGATTQFVYDTNGRVVTEVAPEVINPVTNLPHLKVTRNSYDGDGNLARQVLDDEENPDMYPVDAPRVTTYTYDNHDRRASTSVNDQNGTQRQVSATGYDGMGHVAWTTDANGVYYRSDYVNGLLADVVLIGYVDPNGGATRNVAVASYGYDAGGRRTSYTTANGQEIDYTYTHDDLLFTQTAVNFVDTYTGQPRAIPLHSYTYDKAGNVIQDVQGSAAGGTAARTTGYGYDAANQRTSVVADQGGFNPQTTTFAYDPAGLLRTTTTPITTTTNQYNPTTGELFKTAVANTTGDLVTQYTRDGQLVLSSTDPRGASAMGNTTPGNPAYTTNNTYDVFGRLSSTTGPPVTVENGTEGNVAYNVRPTTTYGYDAYGEISQVRDPNANVTSITYDNRGQRTQVGHPTYLTPAGNYLSAWESWTYDNAGNVLSYMDPRRSTTNYDYDMRNRPYQITLPPTTTGGTRPTARMSYDDDSKLLSLLDPTAALTTQTFDTLDRRASLTKAVRQPSPSPTRYYNTYYRYDDFGDVLTTLDDTTGFKADKTYDQFGNVASEQSTGRGITGYSYDPAGRVTSIVDPIVRTTLNGYDLAGRLTSVQHGDSNGNLVDATIYDYDKAGNRITTQDPNGRIWKSDYDAAGRLITRTDPWTHDANGNPTGTPVTSMGYDAVGNRTRVTDANGHDTLQTYQAWNLPESLLEPRTSIFPNPPERTSTITYDVAGSPAHISKPGGITQDANYDLRGQLTGFNARGGDGDVAKTFGYDNAGRMTSAYVGAYTPPGVQSFGYDDRGLIISSSGPQGSATYGYDSLGRLTSQSDPAGTVTQTYSGISDVGSITDSLSGTTRNFTRDPAGQVSTEQYSQGASRSYTYDGVGRVATDVTRSPGGGAITASTSYDRDKNGNLKQVITGGQLGVSIETNTYDEANRLTRYQLDNGSLYGQDYTWDKAGNRTALNAWSGTSHTSYYTTSATYDERNRLTNLTATGPASTSTYYWSARGTLASIATTTGGSTTATTNRFDAFDRMISQGSSSYTYEHWTV